MPRTERNVQPVFSSESLFAARFRTIFKMNHNETPITIAPAIARPKMYIGLMLALGELDREDIFTTGILCNSRL